MELGKTVPFLKWAGGKRWLVKDYSRFFPQSFSIYFEPFLGSGAVFFHLKPKQAQLSDLNSELINVYNSIKERPDLVLRYLSAHEISHSEEYYYKIRETSFRSNVANAARTIYLNRTCWNALYRVNLNGKFNVPKGSKDKVMLESDNFNGVAKLLERANLNICDFEETVNGAGKNDFVFLDPPYTVNHNQNGFLKYNEKIFSWDDQIRLRDAADNAAARGAKILVTNADHESIFNLYKDFSLNSVNRTSVIAASRKHRGLTSELVIRSWK